jgi:hypothetical protein
VLPSSPTAEVLPVASNRRPVPKQVWTGDDCNWPSKLTKADTSGLSQGALQLTKAAQLLLPEPDGE